MLTTDRRNALLLLQFGYNRPSLQTNRRVTPSAAFFSTQNTRDASAALKVPSSKGGNQSVEFSDEIALKVISIVYNEHRHLSGAMCAEHESLLYVGRFRRAGNEATKRHIPLVGQLSIGLMHIVHHIGFPQHYD